MKPCKSKQPTSLYIDNELVSDSNSISEAFNSFFTNIGPNIASKIPKSKKYKFETFLKKNLVSSFYLSPTNENEIEKIISSLKSGKSTGPNSIPIFILKHCSKSLSSPHV